MVNLLPRCPYKCVPGDSFILRLYIFGICEKDQSQGENFPLKEEVIRSFTQSTGVPLFQLIENI